MPKVAINDIQVYYEIHGRDDPLMLIVGLKGVGTMWGPQIPLFAIRLPYHRSGSSRVRPEERPRR